PPCPAPHPPSLHDALPILLAEALHEEAANGTGSEPFVWSRVDSVLSGSIDTPCRITARAIGSRLDINNADEALISRLFVRVGFGDRKSTRLNSRHVKSSYA